MEEPRGLDGSASPSLFSSDEEDDAGSQQRQSEEKIVRNTRKMLTGVPPPPALTVSYLSAENIVQLWNENVGEYGLMGLESHKPEKESVYFLNISNDSEEIASMFLKVQERFVRSDTMSTCNIWFQSYVNKLISKKQEQSKVGKSPGRRLSHLAKRRQVFSFNNVASMSGTSSSAVAERHRLIPVRRNKHNVTVTRALKSTSSTPSKSMENKLKLSRRALFQSPEHLSNTEKKKRMLKRKLFSSSDKKRKPTINILSGNNKRRRTEQLLSVKKCPRRSLTFDDDNCGSSRADDVMGPKTQLCDLNRKKLVWTVFETLKENNICKSHKLYKTIFRDLFSLCKNHIEEILSSKNESGTTAKMIEYARKHFDDIARLSGYETDKQKVLRENTIVNNVPQDSPVLSAKKRLRTKSNVDPEDLALCWKTPKKKMAPCRVINSCSKLSVKEKTSGRRYLNKSSENLFVSTNNEYDQFEIDGDWNTQQEVILEANSFSEDDYNNVVKFPYLQGRCQVCSVSSSTDVASSATIPTTADYVVEEIAEQVVLNESVDEAESGGCKEEEANAMLTDSVSDLCTDDNMLPTVINEGIVLTEEEKTVCINIHNELSLGVLNVESVHESTDEGENIKERSFEEKEARNETVLEMSVDEISQEQTELPDVTRVSPEQINLPNRNKDFQDQTELLKVIEVSLEQAEITDLTEVLREKTELPSMNEISQEQIEIPEVSKGETKLPSMNEVSQNQIEMPEVSKQETELPSMNEVSQNQIEIPEVSKQETELPSMNEVSQNQIEMPEVSKEETELPSINEVSQNQIEMPEVSKEETELPNLTEVSQQQIEHVYDSTVEEAREEAGLEMNVTGVPQELVKEAGQEEITRGDELQMNVTEISEAQMASADVGQSESVDVAQEKTPSLVSVGLEEENEGKTDQSKYSMEEESVEISKENESEVEDVSSEIVHDLRVETSVKSPEIKRKKLIIKKKKKNWKIVREENCEDNLKLKMKLSGEWQVCSNNSSGNNSTTGHWSSLAMSPSRTLSEASFGYRTDELIDSPITPFVDRIVDSSGAGLVSSTPLIDRPVDSPVLGIRAKKRKWSCLNETPDKRPRSVVKLDRRSLLSVKDEECKLTETSVEDEMSSCSQQMEGKKRKIYEIKLKHPWKVKRKKESEESELNNSQDERKLDLENNLNNIMLTQAATFVEALSSVKNLLEKQISEVVYNPTPLQEKTILESVKRLKLINEMSASFRQSLSSQYVPGFSSTNEYYVNKRNKCGRD